MQLTHYKFRIYTGFSTSPGAERRRNEDVFVQRKIPMGYFAAVADGSGANEAGDTAAALTLATMLNEIASWVSEPVEALRSAFEAANARLRDQSKRHKAYFGATCVACVISEANLVLAHAGDCRGYLLRGANLFALTRDHSVVQELEDIKGPGAADQFVGTLRHVVSRAVGAEDDIEPAIRPTIPLVAGDTIMLCSDGLTGMVTDKVIRRVLAGATPREAAARLVELAAESRAMDDTTVVVLRVDTDPSPREVKGISIEQLKTMVVRTADGDEYPIIDAVFNPNTWAVVGLRLDLGAQFAGATCEIPVMEVGPLVTSDDVILTPQRSEALFNIAEHG